MYFFLVYLLVFWWWSVVREWFISVVHIKQTNQFQSPQLTNALNRTVKWMDRFCKWFWHVRSPKRTKTKKLPVSCRFLAAMLMADTRKLVKWFWANRKATDTQAICWFSHVTVCTVSWTLKLQQHKTTWWIHNIGRLLFDLTFALLNIHISSILDFPFPLSRSLYVRLCHVFATDGKNGFTCQNHAKWFH